MGLFALMYVLPNVDNIGGFLLVFGAGCAVAAWVNVGTPRVSYGGYQIGLAFWKPTLQGFGMAMSTQVIRDRLIGIAFGLIVYGLVEHYLWPERATDALRVRLSDVLRLLDAWRRRISLNVAEVQALIESSKFEPRDLDIGALERKTADAQIVLVLILTLARHRRDPGLSEEIRARARETTAPWRRFWRRWPRAWPGSPDRRHPMSTTRSRLCRPAGDARERERHGRRTRAPLSISCRHHQAALGGAPRTGTSVLKPIGRGRAPSISRVRIAPFPFRSRRSLQV